MKTKYKWLKQFLFQNLGFFMNSKWHTNLVPKTPFSNNFTIQQSLLYLTDELNWLKLVSVLTIKTSSWTAPHYFKKYFSRRALCQGWEPNIIYAGTERDPWQQERMQEGRAQHPHKMGAVLPRTWASESALWASAGCGQ